MREESVYAERKRKAATLSFDDGVEQDIHLIDILSKYGLKATFNLNSGLWGVRDKLTVKGKEVRQDKILPTQVDKVYRGYEVGVYTLTHSNLTEQPKETIIRQVKKAEKPLKIYTIILKRSSFEKTVSTFLLQKQTEKEQTK
ncbi:MAG: polysaccharide deacetylase family protein [Clostridia bacterium]|nr:polysaccharide deacetylase family protein [Clostridia bacterium]